MSSFKHFRAYTTDMAVASRTIVELFDVFGDVLRSRLSIFVNVLLDPFFLEAAEKRFGNSIVPAISSAAHAGLKMMGFAEPPPGVAPVLRALIGMNQSSTRPPASHGHQNGIKHELPMDSRASRPANDPSRVKIQDYGQVQPALPGPDI